MTIGLSLIVRNGAGTLPRLLEPLSDQGWELTAVDTGSTDDTKAILRAHGATIVDRPWDDDLSAARNAALDAGRSEWVLSLDADEWLTADGPIQLEALTQGSDADAYVLETINYVNGSDPATTRPTTGEAAAIAPHWFLSAKVRLFRRHGPGGDARWEGPVHELVDFSARRAGYRTARSLVRVHHDGLLAGRDPETYGRRAERAIADGQDHPGIRLIVAVRLLKRGEVAGAEALLRSTCAAEPAYAAPAVWLSRLLADSGRRAEARSLLLAALQATTGDADVLAELIAFAGTEGDEALARVMTELASRLHPGHPYWS